MGDRIMMTTLDKRVATYANPDPLNLKFLTETESFELLIMRALGKGSCPDVLVQLGESIAEKCDGVPLAVVDSEDKDSCPYELTNIPNLQEMRLKKSSKPLNRQKMYEKPRHLKSRNSC
ncbi:hypothetical protein P3S68_032904 [Capsicum galapagoense]